MAAQIIGTYIHHTIQQLKQTWMPASQVSAMTTLAMYDFVCVSDSVQCQLCSSRQRQQFELMFKSCVNDATQHRGNEMPRPSTSTSANCPILQDTPFAHTASVPTHDLGVVWATAGCGRPVPQLGCGGIRLDSARINSYVIISSWIYLVWQRYRIYSSYLIFDLNLATLS